MALPYLDIDTDVKPWLGIASDTYDDILTIIRDSVEQAVLDYTEAVFESTSTTDILDASGNDVIVVRNTPIISVSAIYFWVNPDGTEGSLVDTDHYKAESNSIVLQSIFTPQFGRALVRVDYDYGYDGLPSPVKHAILLSIEAEFRRKGDKTIGRSGRSKKDESESYGGSSLWDEKVGLPKEAVYKLNPYRQSMEFPVQPIAIRNP